jgi:RNA polymerase sigma-70 factor (ECF subfamily)
MSQAGREEPSPREDFLTFYEREYRGLVALSASLIGDRSMAEDIAQDALLAAYGRWPEVGALESPIGWTRRVVTNRSVSQIRRRVAELRAVARLGSRAKIVSGLESDADFWLLVRSLPRRQAQVVALHYVSDMTVVDIAAALGCQEGSVKASLFKARKNLMARLEAVENPSERRSIEGEDSRLDEGCGEVRRPSTRIAAGSSDGISGPR